jgi:HTH-type transcriptional regulator / antitoxin HigA
MSTQVPSNAYMKLIRKYPLRPIRSEHEYDRAVAAAMELDARREDLVSDEQDYLEVLAKLIADYDSEQHPVPDVSGPEMLKNLIEFRGLSQVEVAEGAGLRESALSAILRGKRPMGRKTIETLARYFRVDPGLFLAR